MESINNMPVGVVGRRSVLLTLIEAKEFYLSVVSGRKGGAIASLALNALRPVSYLYGGLLWTRNLLYYHDILPTIRLPIAVISVGNITLGGTGKTPLIEFLARFLTERGKKVVILSRGYADYNGMSDESIEFRQRLPNIPVLLGKDRLTNAKTALEEFHPQCMLLDDGFQHLRLARDLDIVVIDSLAPFGTGDLLPAGTLREPLNNLKRANLFVLSRTNLCTTDKLQDIKAHLTLLNGSSPVVETVHHPLYLEDTEGNCIETSYLKGKKIFAFCGLGNPDSFEKTLQLLGANIVGFKSFPDHHYYTTDEAKGLVAEATKHRAEAIVTTGKDKVKLHDKNWPLRLFSLRIEIRITKGREILVEALRKILPW